MAEEPWPSYIKGGIDFNQTINTWQVEQALKENIKLLDPSKHKALWNLNVAILAIFQRLDRTQRDVEILHNKIQPILKQLSD